MDECKPLNNGEGTAMSGGRSLVGSTSTSLAGGAAPDPRGVGEPFETIETFRCHFPNKEAAMSIRRGRKTCLRSGYKFNFRTQGSTLPRVEDAHV